jgi:5-formyltetrahydrofolate cyclo-ligase
MDKQQQRQLAYLARNAQVDKDKISATICQRIIELPEYQQAETVLWYVHCRSEVRTLSAFNRELQGNKRMVVPYCTVDENGEKCLGLWLLKSMEELQPGMWNILEPPAKSRWQAADRQIQPNELDLLLVPGVAFDVSGGRLGNGAGYYDRLLSQVRTDALRVGVCYESQIVSKVVRQAHDVLMHRVITEEAIYSP